MAAFRRPLGQPFFKSLPGVLDVLPSTGATDGILPPQYDYQLPPLSQFPTSGRSGYNSPLPAYAAAAVNALVGQYDYPLPPPVIWPVAARTWINAGLRAVVTPTIAQYHWPLPQRPVWPATART